jgi:hypothetical protein
LKGTAVAVWCVMLDISVGASCLIERARMVLKKEQYRGQRQQWPMSQFKKIIDFVLDP